MSYTGASEALQVPRTIKPTVLGWIIIGVLVLGAGLFVVYKKTGLFGGDESFDTDIDTIKPEDFNKAAVKQKKKMLAARRNGNVGWLMNLSHLQQLPNLPARSLHHPRRARTKQMPRSMMQGKRKLKPSEWRMRWQNRLFVNSKRPRKRRRSAWSKFFGLNISFKC